jgi:cyclopropane fatty-acyl-phospholipid synthase-like methyltransferase
MGGKKKTLLYYSDNAIKLCERYNSVDFCDIQNSINAHLLGAKRVLDIGCGSGRDAHYLSEQGFDVVGIDGSEEMLKSAESNYPELKGRLIKAILPAEFPSFKEKFDGAYSIATLMHFDSKEITKILQQLKEILLPKSPVYISVSGKRTLKDERYFIDYSKNDWINIFDKNGFAINNIIETQDAANRELEWYSFLMETK